MTNRKAPLWRIRIQKATGVWVHSEYRRFDKADALWSAHTDFMWRFGYRSMTQPTIERVAE